MAIIFETSNINEKVYTKLIKRQLYINLGFKEARKLFNTWNIVIYPLEAAEHYKEFFAHVEGETNLGIAWGVTMPKPGSIGGDLFCFIRDTKNPFILRSNMTKVSHELAHMILYKKLGKTRAVREFDEPGAKAGSEAAAYVTLVHDQFYGRKKFRIYWVRYGLIWLPVRILDIYSILH